MASHQWILFDPSNVNSNFTSADDFLERIDPTAIGPQQCAWIAVNAPKRNISSEGDDPESLKAHWNQLPDDQKNPETVQMLAHQYQVLIGKWLVYISPAHARPIWQSIVRAVIQGKLGPTAKISPHEGATHVICIYTENFTNELDVLRVRHELSLLGLTKPLVYKPDAYTHLVIYKDNPWGIRPSLYRV